MLNRVRSHAAFFKSWADPRQPAFLIFYVTRRCNYQCGFCFYKPKDGDELRVDEIRQIARQAGPIIQLSLTGGEPLLRHDLDEIAHIFIAHNHVRFLTVPTNGSLPDRAALFVEQLASRHPQTGFRIAISIDGVGGRHDALRQAPGAYSRLKATYAALLPLRSKFPNLVIDCNMTFSAANEDTILDDAKTISREFSFDNMSATYVRGETRDPAMRHVSFKKYLELNDWLAMLPRTREKRFLYPVWRAVRDVSREQLIAVEQGGKFVSPCVAGRKMLVIRETGDVQPCEILDKTFGNIRDHGYSLRRVLDLPSSRELVSWIKTSQCSCTFECALASNVIWSSPDYLKLAYQSFRNIGAS